MPLECNAVAELVFCYLEGKELMTVSTIVRGKKQPTLKKNRSLSIGKLDNEPLLRNYCLVNTNRLLCGRLSCGFALNTVRWRRFSEQYRVPVCHSNLTFKTPVVV